VAAALVLGERRDIGTRTDQPELLGIQEQEAYFRLEVDVGDDPRHLEQRGDAAAVVVGPRRTGHRVEVCAVLDDRRVVRRRLLRDEVHPTQRASRQRR
jgi:hypothetical protein